MPYFCPTTPCEVPSLFITVVKYLLFPHILYTNGDVDITNVIGYLKYIIVDLHSVSNYQTIYDSLTRISP